MKRLLFLILLLPLSTHAQDVLLPSWVVDSLLFETSRGRACNELQKAQSEELKAMGAELVATGTALKLSESQNGTLTSLIGNSEKEREIDARQYALDKSKMKQKIKRLWVWVGGEGIVILCLLILL